MNQSAKLTRPIKCISFKIWHRYAPRNKTRNATSFWVKVNTTKNTPGSYHGDFWTRSIDWAFFYRLGYFCLPQGRQGIPYFPPGSANANLNFGIPHTHLGLSWIGKKFRPCFRFRLDTLTGYCPFSIVSVLPIFWCIYAKCPLLLPCCCYTIPIYCKNARH